MISEKAIRERSYEIWLRAGCPEDRALEHWLRAEVELRSEHDAKHFRLRSSFAVVVSEESRTIMARPSISLPPRRVVSRRVKCDDGPIAATR